MAAKPAPEWARIVVRLPVVEGTTKTMLKDYVADAVGSWCGALRPPGGEDEDDPGDPLWGIGEHAKVEFDRRPRIKP